MRLLFEVTGYEDSIGKTILTNYAKGIEKTEKRFIHWDGVAFRSVNLKTSKSKKKIKKENNNELPQKIRRARKETDSSYIRMKMGYLQLIHIFSPSVRWIGIVLSLPFVVLAMVVIYLYKIIKFLLSKGYILARMVKKELTKFSFTEGDVVVVDFAKINEKMMHELDTISNKLSSFSVVCMVQDNAIKKDSLRKEIASDYSTGYAVRWVAKNADAVVYGSDTLKEMFEAYCEAEEISLSQKQIVNDAGAKSSEDVANQVAKKVNGISIPKNYIVTFGDFSENCNQDILYRSFAYLFDTKDHDSIPNLVLVGDNRNTKQLTECIKKDPRVITKMTMIPFYPEMVEQLIRDAMFVLIPDCVMSSKYILFQSLNLGKVCIVSDSGCLDETEKALTICSEKNDVIGWANAISDVFIKEQVRKQKEQLIADKWEPKSWKAASESLLNIINQSLEAGKDGAEASGSELYYDLTLFVNLSNAKANISGIPRTQLILARKLWNMTKKIHFFAIINGGYIEIDSNVIEEILDESLKIDQGFKKCAERLRTISIETRKIDFFSLKNALAMFLSVLPDKLILTGVKIQKKRKKRVDLIYGLPFNKGDIVFSAGTGFLEEEAEAFLEEKEQRGFLYYQLLYDFTPVLTPQTHTVETNEYYDKFFEWSYKASDVVFYGGEAAMKDGEDYVKQNNLPMRPGKVVRFGSDIGNFEGVSKVTEKDIYDKYKIGNSFLLTVGSIEPRKNYETLYMAYQWWQKFRDPDTLPQLVVAGYPGWKSEEFLEKVKHDSTVKDKIIICTPSDEELDYLYRNCRYTVLASQYEGWSLTVPQSMRYNKFCLASDVNPLVEIGKDFLDYVHPLDIKGWAEKMDQYYFDEKLLEEKEQRIKDEWHSITWAECADKLYQDLI